MGWEGGHNGCKGFPRTRGDRPTASSQSACWKPSPDRGSPAHAGIDRFGPAHVVLSGGSPAHAGIDVLDRRPGAMSAAGIFRGSPAHAGIDRYVLWTWRWFPRTRSPWERGRGSPAHAGIDPSGWVGGSPAHAGIGGRLAVEGSPAHAGIDRVLEMVVGGQLRFPRTRGDRPKFYLGLGSDISVPPHTRG